MTFGDRYSQSFHYITTYPAHISIPHFVHYTFAEKSKSYFTEPNALYLQIYNKFYLVHKFLACWCTWIAFFLAPLSLLCFWKVKPAFVSQPNILFTYWKSDNSKQDNPALSFRGGFAFKNTLSKPERQKANDSWTVDGLFKTQEKAVFAVIIKFTQDGSEYQQLKWKMPWASGGLFVMFKQ